MNKITQESIENILGFKMPDNVVKKFNDFNLEYETLSAKERDEYLLHVINVLLSENIVKSGDHRIQDWENGWGENFELYKQNKDENLLIPKYHGKYNLIRWCGDLIKSKTENLEYKLHICLVDSILQHYIGENKNVFEFGCGSAHHLLRLNNFNNDLNLTGCDWATSSQKIIKQINENLNTNINGHRFDFFNPDYSIEIQEKSAVYTLAALEQVGDKFKSFVDFLLDKKPSVCIHMEPIDELLDSNNLIDKLSILYFRKRNYLNGFLPYLEELERNGVIEIIKKQRIFYGSYFIEGHSLIVWKPKNN